MVSWRAKLREAEESFKQGRLDAAERFVHQYELLRYRKGQRLAEQLATAFSDRAREMAACGAVDSGWRDLNRAKSLGARADDISQLEKELVEAGLAKARDLMQVDDFERTLTCLADLELMGIADARLKRYQRAAEGLRDAASLSRSGRFLDAEDRVDAVAELLPGPTIANRRKAIRQQAVECRRLTTELQTALTTENWEQALDIADQLLDRAPQYKVARDARRRAVDALAEVQVSVPMTAGISFETSGNAADSDDGIHIADDSRDVEDRQTSCRFILWVDGVGGYLTCLNSTLTVGQAVPDTRVDIPIQGDLSACHATLKRVGDEYLLEPHARVLLNGRLLREQSLLTDADEIQLGEAVRLKFRRPHVLSASARLEFITRHRTHPWTDAIVLMAESCVLGPSKRNHIFCRDWRDDVVLFRQDDELCCRAMETLEIDGKMCDSSATVKTNSRVAGEDFSITFEAF